MDQYKTLKINDKMQKALFQRIVLAFMTPQNAALVQVLRFVTPVYLQWSSYPKKLYRSTDNSIPQMTTFSLTSPEQGLKVGMTFVRAFSREL